MLATASMIFWVSINKRQDRKSTRLNSSHTVIYTLSLHDALPILAVGFAAGVSYEMTHNLALDVGYRFHDILGVNQQTPRSEERRVGKECRSLCDWSSDVCSSDLGRWLRGWCFL